MKKFAPHCTTAGQQHKPSPYIKKRGAKHKGPRCVKRARTAWNTTWGTAWSTAGNNSPGMEHCTSTATSTATSTSTNCYIYNNIGRCRRTFDNPFEQERDACRHLLHPAFHEVRLARVVLGVLRHAGGLLRRSLQLHSRAHALRHADGLLRCLLQQHSSGHAHKTAALT